MPEPLGDPITFAGLDEARLRLALRALWEDAGPLVHRLVGRSFSSWSEVVDEAEREIATMSDEERAGLLRAHPRLGDSPAALLARSEASWREQGAGQPLDEPTARCLHELNEEYEAVFGFPFVEWVRGRQVGDIVAVIEARLRRDRRTELDEGCAAMIAIARDRLARSQVGG